MVGSFFLDKSDPGSWRALNGLAPYHCTFHGNMHGTLTVK
ncbi:hypothetical protein ABIB51_001351 [Arthrobacter sp. UYCu712]